jgi:hypothetical protein
MSTKPITKPYPYIKHVYKTTPTPSRDRNMTPIHTFHNHKSLLICGDIESNPGPRSTLLSNHPQAHTEKLSKTRKLLLQNHPNKTRIQPHTGAI